MSTPTTEQRDIHRLRTLNRWREGWNAKDRWERFAIAWHFFAVVALRKELCL